MLMVDASLSGRQIKLRKSQSKFVAKNNRDFNVIRLSKFNQGYLNKQIMMLLNSIGAPEAYFMEK